MTFREEEITDYILNLWNGIATLTLTLPENTRAGDKLCYKSVTSDPTQLRPFAAEFQIEVLEECIKPEGKTGERKKPPSEEKGENRAVSSSLALPQVIEVHKVRWEEFGFNDNSALNVMDTGDNGYDFFVNMDNLCLLSEIKAQSEVDARLLGERYKYALVLVGLALLKEYLESNEQKNGGNVLSDVSQITSRLSPILLPMISYLGDLEVEH
jgi:hypothetical protein